MYILKHFIITLVLTCFLACSHRCSSNTFYNAYTGSINKNVSGIQKPYFLSVDSQIKKFVFEQLCNELQGKRNVLIVEASDQFSFIRKGIMYVYDSDVFFSFENEKPNDKVEVHKGSNGPDFLKKIIAFVKNDFSDRSALLKSYNESIKKNDAPLVVLSLYQIENNNSSVQTVNFAYSSLPK